MQKRPIIDQRIPEIDRSSGFETAPKLRPNPDWAKLPLFDRSKWQRVRFGDVVENLNETERDPKAAGIERFIGLEHLEPGSLHIRAWGNVADGTTFTRRCRSGQVLFGKRRAYQRKVAVAEFDAVVSGDIYVMAPKNDRLLPELLPFLCLSERFFQFAVETSAGSLSPRTNWSHLAQFEFALPPLDQQRRIAEILWAVDEAVQLSIKHRAAIDACYSAAVQSLLFDKSNPAVRVVDLCEVNASALSETRTDRGFRFKYIDISSIVAPKTIGPLQTHEFATAPSRARRRVKEGDILISTVRPNLKAFARLGRFDCEHVASTGFAVITPKIEVIGNLFFHAFFSPQYMAHCKTRVTGTSYPAMNAKDVGDFLIHLPKGEVELEKAQFFLNELESASMSITEHITKGSKLLNQFVESITTEES
ncbi:MAG: restriction endonuclease subunit S [Candidatus Aureabacteria bacterium]|nr:restriction endonuclease subunit S [Candidatus Auribacterota bacterium]